MTKMKIEVHGVDDKNIPYWAWRLIEVDENTRTGIAYEVEDEIIDSLKKSFNLSSFKLTKSILSQAK